MSKQMKELARKHRVVTSEAFDEAVELEIQRRVMENVDFYHTDLLKQWMDKLADMGVTMTKDFGYGGVIFRVDNSILRNPTKLKDTIFKRKVK